MALLDYKVAFMKEVEASNPMGPIGTALSAMFTDAMVDGIITQDESYTMMENFRDYLKALDPSVAHMVVTPKEKWNV